MGHDIYFLKKTFSFKDQKSHKKIYTTPQTTRTGIQKSKKLQKKVVPRGFQTPYFGDFCTKFFFYTANMHQSIIFGKNYKKQGTWRWLGAVGPVEAEI